MVLLVRIGSGRCIYIYIGFRVILRKLLDLFRVFKDIELIFVLFVGDVFVNGIYVLRDQWDILVVFALLAVLPLVSVVEHVAHIRIRSHI